MRISHHLTRGAMLRRAACAGTLVATAATAGAPAASAAPVPLFLFRPHQTIVFNPAEHVELTTLTITST